MVQTSVSHLQGLKDRIVAFLDTTTDEEKLQRCWVLNAIKYSNDIILSLTDEEGRLYSQLQTIIEKADYDSFTIFVFA